MQLQLLCRNGVQDVYSFGVVLWELLTFQIPWAEATHFQIYKTIMYGSRLPIPDSSELPNSSDKFEQLDMYVELIGKCCSQNPADRPTFHDAIARLR